MEAGVISLFYPLFSKFRESSKEMIKAKFRDLLGRENPFVLIFASCHSYYSSEIKDILRSYGVYAVLSMLNDRGEITKGKFYMLDKGQKQILTKVSDDHDSGNYLETKNILLYGNSGTGNVLLGHPCKYCKRSD